MDITNQFLESSYYTDFLCLLIAIIVLMYSKRFKINNRLRIFRYYFVGYIVSSIVSLVSGYINLIGIVDFGDLLLHHMDFLFTIFEYYIFSWYLKQEISRWITVLADSIFAAGSIFLYINTLGTLNFFSNKYIFYLFTFQAIMLLFIAIAYFISINKVYSDIPFKKNPSFWISTGLLIFVLCTLPFSLASSQIAKIDVILLWRLYSIFYIFYIILFIMIMKAFAVDDRIQKMI